jgi:ATP phosphoribosyltransferase regulatory subunit
VARLCYCGPVLHARPASPLATREPLQFGAEIYGHAGLEADLEVQDLALDVLHAAGLGRVTMDMGDARIVRGVLAGVALEAQALTDIVSALTAKDRSELRTLSARCDTLTREALSVLLDLYGGTEVLAQARRRLPQRAQISAALDDLAWLAEHLGAAREGVEIGFDLSDMSGYAYYSGVRFAVYATGSTDALLRGGRYDEVGAVFGRNRPAVGFSLDLKSLAELSPSEPLPSAIRAPWSAEPALRAAVRDLRTAGQTVLCLPECCAADAQALVCDRELVAVEGRWQVRSIASTP